MYVVLKFILKNIKEKKLRTFLIVVSIMASTALFFAANGIATTIKQTEVNEMKSYYGSAEIQIYAGPKAKTQYLSTDKAQLYSNDLDYTIGEMETSATYKPNKDDVENVNVEGVNYDDIMQMNPITFSSSEDLKPFEGNKVIISEKTAAKYNLKAGDNIKLKIGAEDEKFKIVGISRAQGIFQLENQSIIAIMPKDTVQNLTDEKGQNTIIYLKTKNQADKKDMIQNLSKLYKYDSVTETIDMNQINQQTKAISDIFLILLIIVLGMSIFIIYTVFKVITVERLPIIGTFRSIGATKLTTDFVLLLESAFYGIIGGLIGILVGIGIIKLAAIGLSSASGGIAVTMSYSGMEMLEAFIFAVVVSVLSALLPIISVSRLSVKDVVLNTVEMVEKKRLWKFILAVVFVGFTFIAPAVSNNGALAIVGVLGMILGIIGVVMLIPYFTEVIVIVLQAVYALIFRNEGILAAKNLRNNKNILNNISLLTIGISALFMLNVISTSLGVELVKAYGIFKADIIMEGNLNRTSIPEIRNTNGVAEADGIYSTQEVKVQESNSSIIGIYGYNPSDFDKYFNVNFNGKESEILKNVYDNREIVLTDSLMSSIGVKVGDVITLETPKGNKEYTIAGTFSTLMNNGSMAIISEKYLKQDFKVSNYSMTFANANPNADQNKIVANLKSEFKGKELVIMTLATMQAENELSIDVELMLIRMFPIISLIIGAFGVINNFFISYMERKRQLAVMASVGMSRKQTRKMLFIEALSVGIVGAIMGSLGGLLLTYVIPYLLKVAKFPMEMHYDIWSFVICFILGIGITIISSLAPSFKSSKLNIIEAIKYE